MRASDQARVKPTGTATATIYRYSDRGARRALPRSGFSGVLVWKVGCASHCCVSGGRCGDDFVHKGVA